MSESNTDSGLAAKSPRNHIKLVSQMLIAGLCIAGLALFAAGGGRNQILVLARGNSFFTDAQVEANQVPLSGDIKDCAAKLDNLRGKSFTRSAAEDVEQTCNKALKATPDRCGLFLDAAGRAGFTADQALVGTGTNDRAPYDASRRDAALARATCGA